LKPLLEAGRAACKVDKSRVTITAHTTYDEIVDVEASVADDDAKATKAACMREHTWSVQLPGAFSARAKNALTIKLD
jgi:hypothetical protein